MLDAFDEARLDDATATVKPARASERAEPKNKLITRLMEELAGQQSARELAERKASTARSEAARNKLLLKRRESDWKRKRQELEGKVDKLSAKLIAERNK